MFLHIYKTRLKCILRSRQLMFWTMAFPIILGTLFSLAFENLDSAEAFAAIPIAVVDDAAYREDTLFQEALSAVSGDADAPLLTVTYTDEREARRLLEEGGVDGYILCGGVPELVVRAGGLNQSVVKVFLDQYQHSRSAVTKLIARDPAAAREVLAQLAQPEEYLKEIPVNAGVSKTNVNYYYTLIGMACLYGGFLGLFEVMAVQANQSAEAARVNLAPVHKLKVFGVSLLSAVTIQLLQILLLMLYLIFVLGVDFGGQLPSLALVCVSGIFNGAAFGTAISALVKRGEGIKIGVLIGVSMTMSFLAGMMVMSMKYLIQKYAPLLARVNPASLVTDSFYSLYYYSGHERLIADLLWLWGITAVFALVTYLVLRRQRYASI